LKEFVVKSLRLRHQLQSPSAPDFGAILEDEELFDIWRISLVAGGPPSVNVDRGALECPARGYHSKGHVIRATPDSHGLPLQRTPVVGKARCLLKRASCVARFNAGHPPKPSLPIENDRCFAAHALPDCSSALCYRSSALSFTSGAPHSRSIPGRERLPRRRAADRSQLRRHSALPAIRRSRRDGQMATLGVVRLTAPQDTPPGSLFDHGRTTIPASPLQADPTGCITVTSLTPVTGPRTLFTDDDASLGVNTGN
jgi:hypothetical protein